MYHITRTDEEINSVRDQAVDAEDQGSKWPGMSYEQGVGCLEKRLGRELGPADFTDVPLNTDRDFKSERLLARMGK